MPTLAAPAPIIMADTDERLGAVEKWIAAHEARCQIQWEHQTAWNQDRETELQKLRTMIENKFDAVFKRLGAIDKRLAWFTGLAAAAGSTVGALLT